MKQDQRTKKVALITNVPSAYRLDFYQALCQEGAAIFKCFFYGLRGQSTGNYSASLSHSSLNYQSVASLRIPRGARQSFLPLNLLPSLAAFKPDILVCIGHLIPASFAWIYSKLYNIPLLLWWGGIPFSALNKTAWEKAWRRFIFLQARGIIAYCEQAKTDLVAFGYPEPQICVLGNATFNVTQYAELVEAGRQSQLGEKIGEKKEVLLLAVGQLIPRKNYQFLLEVFKLLVGQNYNLKLIIIGEGYEKIALQDFCVPHQLANVELLGQVAYEKLPQYYAQADIFLHPSKRDQWPQVLNEAMAASLPVIVSNCCGVEEELVYNQINGYVLPLNRDLWIETIQELIVNKPQRQLMGAKSWEIINSNFQLEKVKAKFVNFILSAERGRDDV